METYNKLIGELLRIEMLLLVIDSGGAVGEMHVSGTNEPEFEDKWATIKDEGWHVHLNMQTIEGVQFVEAEDHGHSNIPKLYYVRMSDADGRTLLRFYFPNPWLNDDEEPSEFQPAKLKLFEGFRDRYVGRDGIVFARR